MRIVSETRIQNPNMIINLSLLSQSGDLTETYSGLTVIGTPLSLKVEQAPFA